MARHQPHSRGADARARPLTLFARGVRGPNAKLAPVLQPFQLLLLSWSGRGEAPQLTAAERAAAAGPLPQDRLLAAF